LRKRRKERRGEKIRMEGKRGGGKPCGSNKKKVGRKKSAPWKREGGVKFSRSYQCSPGGGVGQSPGKKEVENDLQEWE